MRLALVVEYEGTRYHGFQYQDNGISIQEEIENSIAQLTCEKVRIKVAGRTDAGVHADGQVIAFDTDANYGPGVFLKGLNHYLPDDIAVKESYEVPETFDPRRDAKSRVYQYTIRNSEVPSPLLRRIATVIPNRLDIKLMKEAAAIFMGTHDFESFSGPLENDKMSTIRRIELSRLVCSGERLQYTIEGNAFLPHQIRRMTGAMVDVGRGIMTLNDLTRLVQGTSEKVAHSLPPQGLCLKKVRYERFPPTMSMNPDDRFENDLRSSVHN